MIKPLHFFLSIASMCAFLAAPLSAQELYEELQGVWKAEVIQIVNEREETIPWNETKVTVQDIRVRILEGERAGEEVAFTNDYIPLNVGDEFFLNYLITINGDEIYSVRDIDRSGWVYFFAALFAAVILAFGGKQGLRSLVSLAGSLFAIIYVLIPLLLKGYPPVLTSIGIATLVLFIAIFFTHGFRRSSAVAFGGTALSIIITGVLAFFAVELTRLTGFATDEAVYLNFNTAGELDFSGLLLGGMIIGVLGVLDDIAVTQVAVVRELKAANAGLSAREVYFRAVAVGREHVSALVNTLVLAYAGTALPLLMLLSVSGSSLGHIMNQEAFATEILRTIVGSIGLVLTVPITTALAAWKGPAEEGHKSHHHHYH